MQERISIFQTFSVKIYRLSGESWKIKKKNCIVYYYIFFWKININANAQMSNIKAFEMFKY